MEIDEAYKGREHSQVKHALLRGYLEKLLFIKGVKSANELTYVDCFAGPWGDESNDLHATSIAISLGILKKVRDGLAARGRYVSMKAVYVEKSPESFGLLKSFLETNCPSGIRACPIHGDYADKTAEILRECKDSFTFFFVDPKQWTPVSIPRLSRLLSRKDSEFLITFMYDFLNRFIKKKELREQICSLLGPMGDSEIDALCDLDSATRELTTVRKYRQALKAAMRGSGDRKPRSYHATVLDKDKDRTKYHMVYLTSHPKGIVEFANLSETVGVLQRKVHFDTKQSRTGTGDMFGIDDATIKKIESADSENVKHYWMSRLTTSAQLYNEDDLADMLEETDWLIATLSKRLWSYKKKEKSRIWMPRKNVPSIRLIFKRANDSGGAYEHCIQD